MSVGCFERNVAYGQTKLDKLEQNQLKLSENVEDLKGMLKLALKGYRAQLARLKGPLREKLRD